MQTPRTIVEAEKCNDREWTFVYEELRGYKVIDLAGNLICEVRSLGPAAIALCTEIVDTHNLCLDERRGVT